MTGSVADFGSHVFRDVADMVTVRCEHLDGVWIVGVGRFCFESAFELTKVVVDVFTVGQAGDIEFDNIELIVVFWPDGDVVTFVFDAEVS